MRGGNNVKVLSKAAAYSGNRRNLPGATFLLDRGGNSLYLLLCPRASDDLHADGKSFRRMPDRNHRCGNAQQVEEFRIAPGIEIVDGLAFNLPTALSVPEGGDRRRGAQENGILLHLCEEARAQQIALDPGIEQSSSGVGWFGRRPFQKLLEDGTEIGIFFLEHRPHKHSAGDHEELVPELPGFFESLRLEWFHSKSSAAQGFCGFADGGTGFWSDRRAAIVFEITDFEFLGFLVARPAYRNWR